MWAGAILRYSGCYYCAVLALFIRYSYVIHAFFVRYSCVILALLVLYSCVILLLFWLYSFGYSLGTIPSEWSSAVDYLRRSRRLLPIK